MTISFDKQRVIFWGGFIEIAQSMYSPGVTNPPQPTNFPKGWRLVKNINADAVLGLIDQKEFMGFVAQSIDDPHKFAVVLRGVQGILDILDDADFDMVHFDMIPNGGKTEHGFTRFYKAFTFVDPTSGASQNLEKYLKDLPQTVSFTVAGYSMGGALATLHALVLAYQNIPVEVYTFASPMVGNPEFVKMYNTLVHKTYRIVNVPDIIPKLPGTFFGYQHVTPPFLINSLKYPQIKQNINCFHHIEVYLFALGATNTNLGMCKA
jgi:hypothetical protein